MNTIKKIISIALLLVTFNVATAAKASANVLDDFLNWMQPTVSASGNMANSSQDLFFGDGVTQAILSMATPDPVIQSNAVAPVTNPAASISKPKTARKTFVVSATGYNADPRQTDNSPCITASGLNVCTTDLNVIAANICDSHGNYILPFHTAIKIPSLYGDTIFFVEDRMNRRYCNNIDVFLPDRASAMNLGRRTVTIEVVS